MAVEQGPRVPASQQLSLEYLSLRCSTADRERAIDVLKAAFAEGRLTREEYEDRAGQALAARTYADLAGLTADLPSGPLGSLQIATPPPMPLAYGAPPVPVRPPLSGLAVAALFTSLILPIPWLGFVLAICAKMNIRRTGKRGDTLATAALIISGLFTLLMLYGVARF